MREAVIQGLIERFNSYVDLVSSSDIELSKKLDVPKHKSLGEHLWCIVGARESYAKALRAGKWDGFSCSMKEFSQSDFTEKLKASADEVRSAIEEIKDWSQERDALLLALSDHEVMHEGQIIRHLYGIEYEIPSSIKWA